MTRTPLGRARIFAIGCLLAAMFSHALYAATPVTITFEDIHNKPFGHDSLPPFTWHGVLFAGGGLHRTDSLGTWYQARNRNAIELKFPPGSTDISFDVDGRSGSIILFELMPIQVWQGTVGLGTLVQTLPIPASIADIYPPKHEVTVPGPASLITIFTAPPPSGISNFNNIINLDNIRYTPPDPEPSITFDAVLPVHTRVLTHNYGDYPYPSSLQIQDGAIRVQATVLVNNQPAPGKTIHFRLIDPPDTAPYVQQADDDKFGDNADGPGSLNEAGKTTTTAVSDASGRVSVTLLVTSFAAGDNYQIEASGSESFPCALTCPKSPVFTAWKRVYVEYHKMFRKGAFLTTDVPAGAKEIPVDDVGDLPNPPFEIRLLHAARVDAKSGDFATEERATVVKVRKEPKSGWLSMFSSEPESGSLILDPNSNLPGLLRAYSGPEEINGKKRTYLADAVGVVTGDRATDFLLASGTLVNALFEQAFAEFVWLTDATASDSDLLFIQPRIFFDGVLPPKLVLGGEGLDSHQREWMTRKWLRNAERQGIERVAKANHQALFTTGKFWTPPKSAPTLGTARVASNFNDSWLAIQTIGKQTRIAEATVHELAHQWLVNHEGPNDQALGGHCGHKAVGTALLMVGQSTKYCTMTDGIFSYPEAHDGIVGFHYKKFVVKGKEAVDSEYLRIRRRAEPVPQNEQKPRETPK